MNIPPFNLNAKVMIIAEIGNNHEGKFEVAKTLVHRAAECGADAVKFQTYKTEYFVSGGEKERFARFKSFELTYDEFERLSTLAHSLGLLFISTPLDLESARFLSGIVDCLKIASGDNTFYPLLEQVALSGKPMLVSTGLATFEQIEHTVGFIKAAASKGPGISQMALLHCVSSYPTPAEQANLFSIKFMADRLGCMVGYSDHTLGTDAACLATALGARVIEKHFTLDKHYSSFRDHAVSADPQEMRLLVQRIQQCTQMLGRYEKVPQPAELATIPIARRSIAANKELSKGHRLTMGDLIWIRPASGLPPGQEGQIVGKTLLRDVPFGRFITTDDCQ